MIITLMEQNDKVVNMLRVRSRIKYHQTHLVIKKNNK